MPASNHVHGLSTASTSSFKRHSAETKSGANSVLRSRPSSPAPGSPRAAQASAFDDDPSEALFLKAHAATSARFVGSLDGQTTTSSGVHLDVPSSRHPHPLASTFSSGQSTPIPQNGDAFSGERSPLLSVAVDRPSTPGIQQQEWQRIPHDYDRDFESQTFLSTERGGFIRAPTLRSRVKLLGTQLLANIISTSFLILIVVWALASRALRYVLLAVQGKHKHRHPRPWDRPERWANEKLVKDVKYYARSCGYDIEDQEVVTEDGYKLRVHRVIAPSQQGRVHSDGRGGYPVIIQHGLFQSSGSFVTSEERSLAFWLAEQGGYQVYLGVSAL